MDLKPSQLPGMSELLSPEEARDMDRLVPIKQFKKGTVLLNAGDVATESWFCIEGCVHMYYDVDGDLRTTEFYTEGQPVASLYSFINQVPANHYLACVGTAPWWCGPTPPSASSSASTRTWRAAAG